MGGQSLKLSEIARIVDIGWIVIKQ